MSRILQALVFFWCLLVGSVASAEQQCAAPTTDKPARININTATADELSAHLKGVGKAKAAAIIEWRETNGAFSSLEDLDEVKGIGPALIEKNREAILFKDE